MGKPSTTTHHPIRAPLRIALLLLCLAASIRTAAQATSALSVPLIFPSAIVFDASGDLYFAETANHVIRKIDSSGNLTTIAGTGVQGLSGDNGPAIAATLDSPQGLALDSANHLYIADTHNYRIRKLSLNTGIITTIAGTTAGFSGDNASATSAQLNLPTALALDSSNNLYLADTANHRIRRLNQASGIIATIAGTGTQGSSGDNSLATAATIDSPTGLAIDASNRLYIADTHNHRIRRIDATTGIIATIAGTTAGFSGDNASATAAELALPQGLTIDPSGNLFIADRANHRIRRIDATTGIITTIAGDGTQSFSGDDDPAAAASLDSPRTATLTPSNLLTLADTANQRIRQIDIQANIHTIAGLGVTIPGALTLSAPSVIAYGTGQLTASLATSSPATGTITFFDTVGTATSTIGTAALAHNTATLIINTLPAGPHNLTVTYTGDQTHLAAQSQALSLTIIPQQLTVILNSITLLYGQPIPVIAGTLNGVFPQDAAKVSAAFTSTAALLSPAGTYPITATLTGPAAGNYSIAAPTAAITIAPAPTTTTLNDLIATATTGASIALAAHVASATSAAPDGTITLLDGATPLLTSPLSSTGDAAFTISTLTQGTHNLTAVYNGSTNFTSSTSTPQQITVGTGPSTPTPDFALTTMGSTTQTITSGDSTSFSFTIQPQGALSSPVTLAATGLPNLATASFNPPYLPPGTGNNTVTLTIATPKTATPKTAASNRTHTPIVWALLLPAVVGLSLRSRRLRLQRGLLLAALLGLSTLFNTGCGDRVNTTTSPTAAAAKTYTITVTGTATTATGTTLQHATTVTLILQPPS